MTKDALTKRGQAAEGGFAHEAELAFRAIVLRNRKLGAWAAELMGVKAEKREDYIKQLVAESIDRFQEDAVFQRLLDDFDVYKIDCSERSLRRKMEELLEEARNEIHQGK